MREQQDRITCNHNQEAFGARLLCPRSQVGNLPGQAVFFSPEVTLSGQSWDRKEVKIRPGHVAGIAGLPVPALDSFAMSWPGTEGVNRFPVQDDFLHIYRLSIL